jgi:hypothetical protein
VVCRPWTVDYLLSCCQSVIYVTKHNYYVTELVAAVGTFISI